jgi:hypothetical protein
MQNAPGPSISVDVKDILLEDETLVDRIKRFDPSGSADLAEIPGEGPDSSVGF